MNRLSKFAAALAIAIVGFFPATAYADGVSGDEPEPTEWEDLEGNVFECLDWHPEDGCLYETELVGSGYWAYYVSPEGMRYRVFIQVFPNSGCGGE